MPRKWTACKSCGVGRSAYKGSLCSRCFRAAGGKINEGKVVSDANLGVSPQLEAIRKAVRWEKDELPRNPTVRFYVELRKSNPREVAQQWERLEREHRLSRPVAVPAPVPSPAGAPDSRKVAPAVEEDPVGEKLEGMIEAWLAETGKRVAGTCPCCGQKVKPSSGA